MRVLSAGFGVFTSVLSKILGGQVLTDVQQFVSSIDTLFGGLRERADETYAMLKADDTAFVVVTAPERDALREASYFIERLEGDDMPLAGVVLNRVASTTAIIDEATATSAANRLTALGADTSAAVLRIHAQLVATRDRQRRLAERLTSAHRHVPIAVVPAMSTDVTDLSDLRMIGAELADG
jgi:anion-transporting  ArsA/GET3 family ATPase